MSRGTYALRPCDYCGYQLFTNELIPISDRVLTGTREGTRRYSSSRGFVGRGSNVSKYYSIKNLKICPNCFEQREEQRRRDRIIAFIKASAMVAFLTLVAVLFGSAYLNAPRANPPIENVSVAYEDSAGNAAGFEQPAAAVVSSPEDENLSVPEEAEANASEKSGQAERPTTAVSSEADDDMIQAIAQATPPALQSGEPMRWRSERSFGYIVPSAAQSDGRSICRNVYATVVDRDQQSQSATAKWCRPISGGAWRPEP